MGMDEAVAKFDGAVSDAKKALYQDGFSDGVASVPPSDGSGISKEQEAADIAAAIADLQGQLDADKTDKAALQEKLDKIKELLA